MLLIYELLESLSYSLIDCICKNLRAINPLYQGSRHITLAESFEICVAPALCKPLA